MTWLTYLLIVPAMVGGRLLHELVHAIVARLLGARIVEFTGSVVRYELPAEAPLATDRCIGAAPLVSGLVVGAVAWLVGPPRGPLGVVLAAGWAVYTFFGDPFEDLRVSAVADQPE